MFQSDLLKGRAIFITGGGTGLGLSMAVRLAELGAKLFLAGRREEPLRQAAEKIRKASGECGFATCDVRDPAAVEAAITAAETQFGRVDTLVNSAAGNFIARTEKLSPNAFAAVVGIVLHGTFHCTLALGRRWIAARQPGTVLCLGLWRWTAAPPLSGRRGSSNGLEQQLQSELHLPGAARIPGREARTDNVAEGRATGRGHAARLAEVRVVE